MKKTAITLAVCMLFLAGCSPKAQTASSSKAAAASSSIPVSSVHAASGTAASNSEGEGDGRRQQTFTLGDITAEISLPKEMRVETDNSSERPEGHIAQDVVVVPVNIFDVDEYELYYGDTICRLTIEEKELLDKLRGLDTEDFKLEEEGLITETFTYSAALEEYTYCNWGDYIIYHHPTPGVGGPYSHIVFTHLPTGLKLDFHFSGESVPEAVSYYSDIVSTIQYK